MNNQDCDQHQQGEQDKAHSKGDKVEIDEKTRMIMRLSSSLRRCKTVGSETYCAEILSVIWREWVLLKASLVYVGGYVCQLVKLFKPCYIYQNLASL